MSRISGRLVTKAASAAQPRGSAPAPSDSFDEMTLHVVADFGHGRSRPTAPEICGVVNDTLEITNFRLATSQRRSDAIQIRLPIPACDRVMDVLSAALEEPGMPSGISVQRGESDEHVLISWVDRGTWDSATLPPLR